MAYIYRFELENQQVKREIDFRNYEDRGGKSFQKIIRRFFKENLKSTRVFKEYFEFRLYRAVSEEKVNHLFNRLYRDCHMFYLDIELYEEENKVKLDTLFKPLPSKFFGLVNNNLESRFLEIELIDALDFSRENIENFTREAEKNFKDDSRRRDEEYCVGNLEALYRFYLMDILTASISKELLEDFNWDLEALEHGDLIYLEGFQSQIYDEINPSGDLMIKNELDILIDIDNEITEDGMYKVIKEIDDDYYNKLEIVDFTLLKGEEELRLRSLLNLDLKRVSKEMISKSMDRYDNRLNFNLYNVGHAQSISIENIKYKPFLFFDFGLLDKKSHSQKNDGNLDLSNLELIILSHLHKDHWSGIFSYKEAEYVNYMLPNQEACLVFCKAMAGILKDNSKLQGIRKKNCIYIVDENLEFNFGKIICPLKLSKKDESTEALIKHQTGLSMLLNLSIKGKMTSIFIPGDQQYDFIADEYLEALDVLVASHHGGSYTWEKELMEDTIMEIPMNNKNGLLLISCSDIYNNPSKLEDYRKRGWLKYHITKEEGRFSLYQ